MFYIPQMSVTAEKMSCFGMLNNFTAVGIGE